MVSCEPGRDVDPAFELLSCPFPRTWPTLRAWHYVVRSYEREGSSGRTGGGNSALASRSRKACDHRDNPLTADGWVRRLGERAGLDRIHPHMLRAALSTPALDAGVPLRDVQIAAHADLRTTRDARTTTAAPLSGS
jgi:integrase